MARPNKEHLDHFAEHDYDVASRTVWVGSRTDDEGDDIGIDGRLAEKAIKGIYQLVRASKEKPIKIIINNPGGDVYHGMAIYDVMKACPCHIRAFVLGQACSMASVILQAADERILAPHATIMFHEGYEGHATNHPRIVRNWVKYEEKFGKKLDKILYEAITEKIPDFSKERFDKMNQFDKPLFAEEAVELGLADRIMTEGELFED